MENDYTPLPKRIVKYLIEDVGKYLVPNKFRPYLKEYFFKAGKYEVPYLEFGLVFWIATTLTITSALWIVKRYSTNDPIKNALLGFLSALALFTPYVLMLGSGLYFYYNLKIYHRTKELEDKLPDYLTLVSTNLKGGLSFEKSLWSAIKPEFGILANEVALVSKKVLTGNDVSEAMMEFAKKYNSPTLRRSINLIISEMDSGGKVVDVIDKIIENLKKTKHLKEEMAANTVTYMIFIGALVIVICPLLFALSYQLVHIMTSFGTKLSSSMTTSSQVPISVKGGGVNPSHFRFFSIIANGIIAIFSAMIISIIETGNIKGGVRYIPLFLLSGWFFLTIFSIVFDIIFRGIAF